MNVLFRSVAITGIVSVVLLGLGTSQAKAQGYSVNVSVPGFSMNVGGGFSGSYSALCPECFGGSPSPVVVGTSSPIYTPYYAPATYAVPSTYYYGAPYYGYSAGWYLPYHYGIWW